MEATAHGETGRDDEDVFGIGCVLGVGDFVKGLPRDEHCHDGGFAGAGCHFGAETFEGSAVGWDGDADAGGGGRFSEKDEGFDGFELAKEEAAVVAAGFVVVPVFEEGAGCAGPARIPSFAPFADAGAGLFGNGNGNKGAGRVDGGGGGVGDGVARGAASRDAVEESGGVVALPVLGGLGVGRVDDEVVGFGEGHV